MAWTAPMTFVSGATLTAAQLNTYLSGNLAETAPAKAATVGSYFATSATNQISERTISHLYVGTSETTTSTSFTDLATVGPDPSATGTSRAIWMVQCIMSNSTAGAACYMGLDLSGATTAAASTAACLRFTSATANALLQGSYVSFSPLTAGATTFTAKYAVTAGTGTFVSRRVIVLPY